MKRLLHHIVVLFIGILLALAVGETWVRLTKRSVGTDIVHFNVFPCFEPGSYYFMRMKPNARCFFHPNLVGLSETTVKTNALRLRNPEVQSPKPAERTRILMVGDSFTVAENVEEPNSFPRKTEDILKTVAPNRDIEVVNAGLTGTDTGYDYLYLKNDGLPLNPDIIVIGFYPFNDVYDYTFNTYIDALDKDGFPARIGSRSIYVDPGGALASKNVPFKFRSPITKQSALLSLISDWLYAIQVQQSTPAVYLPRLCLYQESCHRLDTYINENKKMFLGIQKLAQDSGKKLLVVIIPSEFQFHPDKRLDYGITVPLNPSDLNWPNREYAKFFTDQGIAYLDLLPTLAAHKDEPLYIPIDNHFTVRGNEVAAQAVADTLKGLIE